MALESFFSLCAASAANALSRSVERKNFFEDDDTDGEEPPLLPDGVTLRRALLPERRHTIHNFQTCKFLQIIGCVIPHPEASWTSYNNLAFALRTAKIFFLGCVSQLWAQRASQAT